MSTIKVDLLPRERPHFRLDPVTLLLLALVALVGVGFSAYSQQLRARILTQHATIDGLREQVRQAEASLPLIEARRTQVARVKAQIQLIHSLAKDPLRYANLLREVASLLPPNLWLSALSVDPASQSVSLSGSVTETPGRLPLTTLSQLMQKLDHSPYFRDASLASTSRTESHGQFGVTFQMQVKYDPAAAAGSKES